MCNFVRCASVFKRPQCALCKQVVNHLWVYSICYEKVVKPSTLFNCHGSQFLEAEFWFLDFYTTVYLIFFSWILACSFILMYILLYFEPSVLHPLPNLFSYVVASVFSVYSPVPVPLCQIYLWVCVSLLRCCSYFLFYFIFYNSCLLYHVSASTSLSWLIISVCSPVSWSLAVSTSPDCPLCLCLSFVM